MTVVTVRRIWASWEGSFGGLGGRSLSQRRKPFKRLRSTHRDGGFKTCDRIGEFTLWLKLQIGLQLFGLKQDFLCARDILGEHRDLAF